MKLLPRIVVSIILPILVTAASTLYLAIHLLQNSLSEEVEERARATLKQSVARLSLGLEDALDTLRILSRSESLAGPQAQPRLDAMQRWRGSTERFENFFFFDTQARIADGAKLPAPALQGQLQPLLKQQGPSYSSPVFSEDTGELVMLVMNPVYAGQGAQVGSLAGSVKLLPLLSFAIGNTTQRDAHLMVLDQAGRLLAGGLGETDKTAEALQTPGPANAPQASALIQALGPAELAMPKMARIVIDDVAWRALQLRVPELEWRVIYALPERSLFARALEQQRLGLLALLACTLLALAGAAVTRRVVLRPLHQLRQAHAALQAGQKEARAPVVGNDEISELARSFNHMAQSLAETEARFRLMFELFPHPVSLVRIADGHYLDINPAFEHLVGVDRLQARRQGPLDFHLAGSQPDLQTQYDLLLRTGRVDGHSCQIQNAQGETRWLLFSSRLIELEEERLALSVATDITALKQVERQLQQSEQSFTALFDSAPLPMARSPLSNQLNVTYWNKAWYDSFGYAPGSCDGRGGLLFDFWEDPQARSLLIADLVREQAVVGREALLRHADGSVRICEVSGRHLDVQGERIILTSYLDVTESRLAERALRDSEQRFRQLFENAPVALMHAAEDGRILALNQQWVELLGYTLDDIPAASDWWRQAYPDPEARRAARQLWQERIAAARLSDGKIVTLKMLPLAKDGRPLTAIVGGVWVGDSLLLSFFDVSENERAAAAVRLSRQQLLANLENTPAVSVQWYDEQGRALYWNPASHTLFGFSSEEMLGRSLEEVGLLNAREAEDFLGHLARIRASGQAVGPLELELRHRDGSSLWVMATLFPMPLPEGRMGFVCMDVDISHRKQVEAQLGELNAQLELRVAARTQELARRNEELDQALHHLQHTQGELVRAEKLASLGRLVAGVAHELNTPIGNALLMASTLSDKQQQFETGLQTGLRRSTLNDFLATLREASSMLDASLGRANELIGSFKQVAVNQSSHQRRGFDLRAVLHETALSLGPSLRRSGVRLHEEVPEGIALQSYPGPLIQVLMNIINNAVLHAYAPGQGGVISIRAQTLPEAWVRLDLQDDGCGMPPEHLARVFDPFFTTKLGQGGSGLGLHIAYNLVTGPLGGRIEISSELGQGTRVRLELPLEAPQEQSEALARSP
ncbi:PAS domain S-box-containing protein [Paucibacter oligotrophus]|uniref:histidine kinase n=1 Tax=Roseateles oligotrophus TaxID=1769250 RepID=A0A840L372_9BURK|nr:PAS domain S-box protein [Roseateles oligotrophus]MBB4842271.1 PAS domain S-box-containing protein [Roseateles oligotrophus]